MHLAQCSCGALSAVIKDIAGITAKGLTYIYACALSRISPWWLLSTALQHQICRGRTAATSELRGQLYILGQLPVLDLIRTLDITM